MLDRTESSFQGRCPAFTQLLSPFAIEDFFESYWQQRSLLVRGSDPGRFSALLSLADIDELLTVRGLGGQRIRMAKGASNTAEAISYTNEFGAFDPTKGMQAYRDGATLILNHLHADVLSLSEFCRAISDELGIELQCNVYVTPADSQGFPVHYDTHDVFIVQTHGDKAWTIYDSPIHLPLAGQPHDQSGTAPGPVSMQLELREGDLLYIPRGFYHEAATANGMSIHLTLGLMAKSWSELLLEAVSGAALELGSLRAAPSPGFGLAAQRQEGDRYLLLQMLDLVRNFVAEQPLQAVLRPEVLYPRGRTMNGHFLDVVALDELTPESEFALRPGHPPKLCADGERISVMAAETTVSFPHFAAPALERALSGEVLAITAISEDLDEPAKVLLVRKLIEAGLLGLVRPKATPRS
ncbi:MAG: cupin domain-containing protein [Novosphingobium sp.]|nr:cupin domain-containing protein [Novosphingobium sp.]